MRLLVRYVVAAVQHRRKVRARIRQGWRVYLIPAGSHLRCQQCRYWHDGYDEDDPDEGSLNLTCGGYRGTAFAGIYAVRGDVNPEWSAYQCRRCGNNLEVLLLDHGFLPVGLPGPGGPDSA